MKSQHSWQERHDTCLGLLVQTKTQGVACSMSQPQDMKMYHKSQKSLPAAGVVVGIVGGVLLRMADLSAEQVDLLGFLGELMLRLLKMLVLPLVAGSMVAGMPSVPV
jgi:L-cystine uptake protein TcyP (sodium:dicarboxylate symporter family)